MGGAGSHASTFPPRLLRKDRLMPAPGDQVGRAGNPHLGRREGGPAVGPVQRHVLMIEPLGKQHDVLVLGRKNDPVPRELAEVFGRGQRRRRPVPRHGHVGEKEPPVDPRDPRIFDAELFPRLPRHESRPFEHLLADFPADRRGPCCRHSPDGRHGQLHDPQVRHKSQPHAAGLEKLDDARIDEFDLFLADPVDGQLRAGRKARQCDKPRPHFPRPFGHAHQQHNLSLDLDRRLD